MRSLHLAICLTKLLESLILSAVMRVISADIHSVFPSYIIFTDCYFRIHIVYLNLLLPNFIQAFTLLRTIMDDIIFRCVHFYDAKTQS